MMYKFMARIFGTVRGSENLIKNYPFTKNQRDRRRTHVRLGQKQTFAMQKPCPLYPQKRTFDGAKVMSAKGQKRTFAGHQLFCREILSARIRANAVGAIYDRRQRSWVSTDDKRLILLYEIQERSVAGSFTRLHFAFDMATNYFEGFAE